ncbi:MAG: hypothetical protein M9958_00915 [Chitinophagales bacterium]|nr:hypothetical protein [Chitinophagales bacterium]
MSRFIHYVGLFIFFTTCHIPNGYAGDIVINDSKLRLTANTHITGIDDFIVKSGISESNNSGTMHISGDISNLGINVLDG